MITIAAAVTFRLHAAAIQYLQYYRYSATGTVLDLANVATVSDLHAAVAVAARIAVLVS